MTIGIIVSTNVPGGVCMLKIGTHKGFVTEQLYISKG